MSMDWMQWGEAGVIVLVLLLLLPLVGLYVRRRWLSRGTGMFDCALRCPAGKNVWMYGVGRYRGGAFEWFKVFSFSWRPRRTFSQGEWLAVGARAAESADGVVLFANQQIVALRSRSGEVVELGLDPGSATGLSAWLEAAGPGVAKYGHTV